MFITRWAICLSARHKQRHINPWVGRIIEGTYQHTRSFIKMGYLLLVWWRPLKREWPGKETLQLFVNDLINWPFRNQVINRDPANLGRVVYLTPMCFNNKKQKNLYECQWCNTTSSNRWCRHINLQTAIIRTLNFHALWHESVYIGQFYWYDGTPYLILISPLTASGLQSFVKITWGRKRSLSCPAHMKAEPLILTSFYYAMVQHSPAGS